MKPFRFAILGAARIAESFAEGVAPSDRVQVVGVASRDPARAQAFARKFNLRKTYGAYEDALADPDIDAIYNPLPNTLHAPWSIAAMRAGKHVLCEKPLAESEARVTEMFEVAGQTGMMLREAYPYLAQPQTSLTRKLVHDGAIGKLRMIQASFAFTLDRPDDIRFEPALAGGALYDLGCYTLSLTHVLSNECPVRVTAFPEWTPRGVDISCAATLEHQSGLIAQIYCSFRAADHRTALIVGENGSIETNFWNHTNKERPAEIRIKQGLGPSTPTQILKAENANGFRAEAEQFAALVTGNASAWTGATPAQSRAFAATIDALLKSARENRSITLGA